MSIDTKQLLTEAISKVEGIEDTAKTQMVESLNELTLVLAENMFNERKDAINAEHQEAFTQLSESMESALEDKFSEALSEAAVEFMEENQDKFDAALKVDLAESFLTGLTSLVKEHGVLISPETNSLQEAFSEKEAQYVAEIERLEDLEESLTQKVFDLEKTLVLKESTAQLTLLQQEKVTTLSEGLNSTDIESFKQSVTNIVEALGKKESSAVVEEEATTQVNEDLKLTPGQRYAKMFSKQ